jgi:hypothetical protein
MIDPRAPPHQVRGDNEAAQRSESRALVRPSGGHMMAPTAERRRRAQTLGCVAPMKDRLAGRRPARRRVSVGQEKMSTASDALHARQSRPIGRAFAPNQDRASPSHVRQRRGGPGPVVTAPQAGSSRHVQPIGPGGRATARPAPIAADVHPSASLSRRRALLRGSARDRDKTSSPRVRPPATHGAPPSGLRMRGLMV